MIQTALHMHKLYCTSIQR